MTFTQISSTLASDWTLSQTSSQSFPPYLIPLLLVWILPDRNQSQNILYNVFVSLSSRSLTSSAERPTQWRTLPTSWCWSTPPEWSCGTSRLGPITDRSLSWIPSASWSSTITGRGGRPTAGAQMTYQTLTSCNHAGTEHLKFSRPDL